MELHASGQNALSAKPLTDVSRIDYPINPTGIDFLSAEVETGIKSYSAHPLSATLNEIMMYFTCSY